MLCFWYVFFTAAVVTVRDSKPWHTQDRQDRVDTGEEQGADEGTYGSVWHRRPRQIQSVDELMSAQVNSQGATLLQAKEHLGFEMYFW